MPDRTPIRSALATVAALLLAGCTIGTTEPAVVVLEATLAATRPDAPSGSLAALTEGNNTQVSVRIQFAQPLTRYGWRIRQGPCAPSGTGQVGGRASYPDVVTDADGSGGADGTIPHRLLVGERYHAVLVDADDETRTLACGSLVRPVF